MSSSAERKRRHRANEREGKMFAGIWVDRAEAEMALIDTGHLNENDAHDRKKVIEALQRAVIKILPAA